jgi:hypothetical protein
VSGAWFVRLLRRRADTAERGQSLVEMGAILPVLILIVLGTLEFGFMFDHHLTLEYASREGARAGAALADGDESPCGTGDDWVDPRIIAAVQRVLTSPGSPVDVSEVAEIHIYRAGIDGEELQTNVWRHSAGMGPTVDGLPLNFVQFSESWQACNRNNGAVNTDSLGVSITYQYQLQTPFSYVLGNGLTMTDRTVMQLNPTN